MKRRFNSMNELLDRPCIRWCQECGSIIYMKGGYDNYCTECHSEDCLINTEIKPIQKKDYNEKEKQISY